jgi:hypothetical protein
VRDGETLEIDYANRVARNVATGATIAIPKFPPMIEEIYRCGGLPQLARQRYLAETTSQGPMGLRNPWRTDAFGVIARRTR